MLEVRKELLVEQNDTEKVQRTIAIICSRRPVTPPPVNTPTAVSLATWQAESQAVARDARLDRPLLQPATDGIYEI